MRYCHDWNPDALPSEARNAEYSAGVRVASTSQDWLSCAMMRATRESILAAGARSPSRTRSRAASELVQDELHPQLARLVLHDEEHLVVVAGARLLRAEDRVEMQVVAVAHRAREVEAGAVGGRGVGGHGRFPGRRRRPV